MKKYLLLLPLLFSSYAYSASNATVHSVAKPVSYYDAGGGTSRVKVIAKGPAANDPYKVVNALLNRNALRVALRFGGYALAVQAAMSAYEYFYDQEQNEFVKNDFTGNCIWHKTSYGTLGTDASASQCADLIVAKFSEIYFDRTVKNISVSAPREHATGLIFDVSFDQYVGSKYISRVNYEGLLQQVQTSQTPISDSEFNAAMEQALVDAAAANDRNTLQQLLTLKDGSIPQDVFTEVEYDITQTDDYQRAKDLVTSGDYQTTDPNADNYVDPETAAQIQEELARTSEDEVNDLNEGLNDPLTQAQLEEILAQANDDTSGTFTQEADETYEDTIEEMLNGIDTFDGLPADFITLDLPNHSTCQTITLNYYGTHEIPGLDGCAKLQKVKDALAYILALAVAFALISNALKEAN